MSARPTLIFDFDSTLVDFETLEALADIALADAPGAVETRAQIAALTDQATVSYTHLTLPTICSV